MIREVSYEAVRYAEFKGRVFSIMKEARFLLGNITMVIYDDHITSSLPDYFQSFRLKSDIDSATLTIFLCEI